MLTKVLSTIVSEFLNPPDEICRKFYYSVKKHSKHIKSEHFNKSIAETEIDLKFLKIPYIFKSFHTIYNIKISIKSTDRKQSRQAT